MKHHKSFSFGILFLAVFGLSSCVEEGASTLDMTPYFDLKGFIKEKIQEVDSVKVSKQSAIQGIEKQTTLVYSIKNWQEEFDVFTEADINKASSFQSYKTTSSDEMLTHELLPNSKGKVKYIKVAYAGKEVSSISIKIADENLFYTTSTLAELYINNTTNLIDHYSIHTTQKIWFMDANDMRIQGELVP